MSEGTKKTGWLNRGITGLFILVLALAAARPAAAYVYLFTDSGARFHWKKGPSGEVNISYWVHNAGSIDGISMDPIKKALDDSFQAWETVSSAKFSFIDRGYTDIRVVSTKNNVDYINLIIFDTQTTNYTVSTDAGPSVVGITINKFNPDGQIVDSDIVFNDQEYEFTTIYATDIASKRIKLQDVATHEIGHVLGLDHTWIEHATMYPYTRDNQHTLSDDDKAAISNLYPVDGFETSFDSLTGRIYNVDEQPVTGVYVSAIDDSTGLEAVAALSDEQGYYSIRGLHPGSYYLRARTVDLTHVGDYIINHSDPTVFIPQYYPGASSRDAAEMITTGGYHPGYDFMMTTAMLLARYDMSGSASSYVAFGNDTSTDNYLAVRFPADELPRDFLIHGMSFNNSDGPNSIWPRIILARGTESAPDISNPIRETINYIGTRQAVTNVEWEAVPLNNSQPLWVVFQFPGKPAVSWGDGPGIAMVVGNQATDIYYSQDGGSTFYVHSLDSQYDLWLYLTAEITGAAIVPSVALNLNAIDFGKAKVGVPTVLSYPIKNEGQAELLIKELNFDVYRYSATIGAQALPAAIAPGATDTLHVSFSPTRASAYTGTFTIVTNDPVREQIMMPVTGTGIYPVAQVAASQLAFGTVAAGSSATDSFSISNTGEVPLFAWGWSIDGPGFSVTSPDTLEVPAAGSAYATVRFAPLEAGAHSSTLSFQDDDADTTRHYIALSGTASGGGVVLVCDMTGDGAADIADLLYFLLLSRRNPDDPRLDWDGSGGFSMLDVLALLLDIRGGTCPDIAAGTMLAGQGEQDNSLGALSDEEISWLRGQAAMLGLSDRDFEVALAALTGSGGGRVTLPAAFSLTQNRPNPFNPSTAISYSVPQDGGAAGVSLKVYSIGGRLVRVLAEGPAAPGEHTVFWDGTDRHGRKVSSGVYIYRLQAAGKALTRKMVLLK